MPQEEVKCPMCGELRPIRAICNCGYVPQPIKPPLPFHDRCPNCSTMMNKSLPCPGCGHQNEHIESNCPCLHCKGLRETYEFFHPVEAVPPPVVEVVEVLPKSYPPVQDPAQWTSPIPVLPGLDLATFKQVTRINDRVRFIPKQAAGNPHHVDCCNGTIVLFGPTQVWIKLDKDLLPGQGLAAGTLTVCDSESLLIL